MIPCPNLCGVSPSAKIYIGSDNPIIYRVLYGYVHGSATEMDSHSLRLGSIYTVSAAWLDSYAHRTYFWEARAHTPSAICAHGGTRPNDPFPVPMCVRDWNPTITNRGAQSRVKCCGDAAEPETWRQIRVKPVGVGATRSPPMPFTASWGYPFCFWGPCASSGG